MKPKRQSTSEQFETLEKAQRIITACAEFNRTVTEMAEQHPVMVHMMDEDNTYIEPLAEMQLQGMRLVDLQQDEKKFEPLEFSKLMAQNLAQQGNIHLFHLKRICTEATIIRMLPEALRSAEAAKTLEIFGAPEFKKYTL